MSKQKLPKDWENYTKEIEKLLRREVKGLARAIALTSVQHLLLGKMKIEKAKKKVR